MEDNFKIVVVGDVDSGKSTLIGRFLYETGSLSQEAIEEIGDVCRRLQGNFEFAYLLDSLEEERRNQLTIDTTQVFCKVKRGKVFIFIDVPGHQELIKNMLCGVSQADIAILVVDVQKSIEQQTKRHAFILAFLGIEDIILALNKMDVVGFNENTYEKVKVEIIGLFKNLGITPSYILPISAKQGENLCEQSKKMEWDKGLSLISVLNTCFNKKKDNGNFRFPIQDIYNLDGENVAVGKIISGKINKGDEVNILPLNKVCKINTIKVLNKNKSLAKSPESIGLVLDKMDDLRRGQVLCKPKLPQVNRKILAKVFCVHPLKINETLNFRCTTQESHAQIKQVKRVWDSGSLESKTKGDTLEDNDFAEAIIFTENPVVVESFKGFNGLGRFVLQSNREICAVGIIH